MPGLVLIVDDNDLVRAALADLAALIGYEVEVAEDGATALARFQPGRYDALLTDLMMPGIDGLEVARRVRLLDPALAILMISGSLVELSEIEADLKALQIPVLQKPVPFGVVKAALAEAVSQTRACRESSPSGGS